MKRGDLLSLVVPMYNEERVALECYSRLKAVMEGNNIKFELILINDGSSDGTLNIVRELAISDSRVKIIDFARNFGHQIAVTAGIFEAGGDAVVVIDADLQDPPEVIVEMIYKWEEGYDVVYGKRKERKGETWFKLVTAKYFYKTLSSMSDVKIPKDTGDFRLMDRKVVEVFKNMPEKNRFIRGMISWIGFNQTSVEYLREPRFAGETKYPLKKMIKLALDGIISFSTKPLKLVTTVGFLSIILSFIILVYSVITKLFDVNTVKGWTSIMVAITFFSGVQLLSLGIVGEYIARIYDEMKNRPLYIIKEKINFKEERKE